MKSWLRPARRHPRPRPRASTRARRRQRTLLLAWLMAVFVGSAGILAFGSAPAARASSTLEQRQPAYTPGAECAETSETSPGVHVRQPDSTDVTGGLATFPGRIELDVEPGHHYAVCVGFQNRTGVTQHVDFSVRDVTAGDGPGSPIIVTSKASDFGAGPWLTLPVGRGYEMPHGQLVWLDVEIDVPSDATAGSNYAAVALTLPPPDSSDAPPGVITESSAAVATQIFLDIPGAARRSGRLVETSSPRLVWWDGFEIARIDALERLRGLGVAPIKMTWRNTGELSDEISGQVVVRGFTGKAVARIPIDPGLVLRGGERQFTMYWTDPPLIGRFTPTIELIGRDGRKMEEDLAPIWVIPAWWYIAALVIAIAVPTWVALRRRRRMREIMLRLEIAEQRAAAGSDAEGDDGDDEWFDDEDPRSDV